MSLNSDGELIRLRNRTRALEANGAELLARAERAEAANERVRQLHAKRDVFEVDKDGFLGAWRSAGCEACSDPDLIADLEDGALTEDLAPWPCDTLAALNAAESPADAPTAVTAATEAHGGAGEAQEG